MKVTMGEGELRIRLQLEEANQLLRSGSISGAVLKGSPFNIEYSLLTDSSKCEVLFSNKRLDVRIAAKDLEQVVNTTTKKGSELRWAQGALQICFDVDFLSKRDMILNKS